MKERPMLFKGAMVRAILEGRKTQTRRILAPQPIPFGVSSYKGTRQGWIWKPDSLKRSWNDDDCDPYNKEPAKRATWALDQESPYGVPCDRIWVKETFIPTASGTIYRANDSDFVAAGIGGLYGGWKPSIFMPRKLSRIDLEITEIRVERLQDISEEDAKAEGIEPVPKTNHPSARQFWKRYIKGNASDSHCCHTAIDSFRSLWNSINAKPSPIYDEGKITYYVAYPSTGADFDGLYPLARQAGEYRGKALVVIPNPWVWVVRFKKL